MILRRRRKRKLNLSLKNQRKMMMKRMKTTTLALNTEASRTLPLLTKEPPLQLLLTPSLARLQTLQPLLQHPAPLHLRLNLPQHLFKPHLLWWLLLLRPRLQHSLLRPNQRLQLQLSRRTHRLLMSRIKLRTQPTLLKIILRQPWIFSLTTLL